MKRILLLTLLLVTHIAMSQKFDYDQKWKEINKLSQKGEFKSLQPKLDEIYVQAKKDNNVVEMISSLSKQCEILSVTQDNEWEDPYYLVIQKLKTEMNSSSELAKDILKSLLAKTYYKYKINTQGSKENITEAETKSDDISTWSPKQLELESLSLYKQSIQNKQLLQNQKTENWKRLLTTDQDLYLYPTLYDVLMSRYIKALGENNRDAIYYNSVSKNNSLKKTQQELISDLLKFHQNDTDKSAYLNFKRIEITELSGSDRTLEQKANDLIELAKLYSAEEYSSYLYYSAAQLFVGSDKKKALKICSNINLSHKNRWNTNCKSLQESITRKAVNLTLDPELLPDEYIPLKVGATNVSKIYYRIRKADLKEYENKKEDDWVIENNGIFSYTGNKQIREGVWELQTFDDYESHSTVVKLDGLPQGNYELEYSFYPDFTKKDKNDVHPEKIYFMVHDWTMVRLNEISVSLFQLLNRKTGKPLSNLSVSIYSLENSQKLVKSENVKTDTDGFFTLKAQNYNNRYLLNPESGSFIEINSGYYGWRSKSDEDEETITKKSTIFTDRAIYRPGQKVYFKAILYNQKKEQSLIASNRQVTISLHNVNSEKVASLQLVSNEYGSVFGEFIIPEGGITGNYFLESDYGFNTQNISVEEYKRPKFQVTIEPLAGDYTLDNKVRIEGKALSFAGVPISGSKVVYRIEREEIFPYFRGYFIPYRSQPETIEQGETETDDKGNFKISFLAKSKELKKAKEYRTYTYILYADVTDVNGETHTGESRVTIGDLPKKLVLTLPEVSLQKDFTSIGISSMNLNGGKSPAQGKVTVTRLLSPSKIILPNKVDFVPDYQLYDPNLFNQYFPYLPYSKEEQNPQFWKKDKSVVYNFDTHQSDSIKLSGSLAHGFYLVQAYTMFGQDSIKTQKVIEIRENNTLKSANNIFYSVLPSKPGFKVGEKIEINFISNLKEATAVLHLESGRQWILHKVIPIKNGKATYTLIAEKELITNGLFAYSYLIGENGYKASAFQINVTEEPKDLKISTKVFRDKIRPGEKETWELTISGKDKDKITAEVLATLYDASLDQFKSNSFTFSPWSYNAYGILYHNNRIIGYNPVYSSLCQQVDYRSYKYPQKTDLKDISIVFGNAMNGLELVRMSASPVSSKIMTTDDVGMAPLAEQSENQEYLEANLDVSNTGRKNLKQNELETIKARTNLGETAFFFPNLYTDKNGEVKFSFTSPEALTQWKLLILAHTQDLYSGTAQFYTQTQKELMVVPNVPRFLREGDELIISTKINNLADKNLNGHAQLFLFDAVTNKPVDTEFFNQQSQQLFSLKSSDNTEVSWKIKVPADIPAVIYRIVATSGNYSDGEESVLPVLTNRMLVTETLPIYIKENQKKEFKFDKLLDNKSNTLQNFNLSMEMTTNPLWLAVFSLPYLREYPYECSEQLFSRLYGNILSTYIINSSPKIKKVFDNWNLQGVNLSNLEKNQELKNILLEETPWVRNAEDETEQRKRVALLFDLNKMSQENTQAQDKLIRRQNTDGGFAWFEGGNSSSYITETIILGFGQLKNMLGNQSSEYLNGNLQNIIQKAIQYTDSQTIEYIKKQKKNKNKIDGKDLMHYYYVRSFWKDQYKLPVEISKYLSDIHKDISVYFTNYDMQNKAMTAIVLNRYGYKNSAQIVIKNLKETSVEADEMGMYWKSNVPGWHWYQTPVESQTKVIEAFAEITPQDIKLVEEMKVWLLKNRQTHSWNSTKATTNAVYALMNFGKDWSNAEEGVNVFVGNTQFVPSKDTSAEQASGYIKKSWNADQINSEMGLVKIEKTSPGVAWGGLYWQYFENLDKITQADSNIKMQKQLFLKVNTDNGQQLKEISDKQSIKVGDLVTVKLIIKVDRDIQYIHIKDMRASGFEPVNVLSGYKFQNGAGYYESTRDAATNFFFEYLRKGTYVFEYDVRANNKGEFSNGITQLQSMYAPEMSAHSKGIRIDIQ
ncbi:alpha-2-macroglobulin [Apibacter sp. HY039]|uniref:alpha-2-macroglobulin family protein n=1 Tax=Apibacter sp. HY039 TaxID=2501476 RepID=UPI000FEBB3CF|nr:MG2 domain-containing protein [Apibacter sp. HY039]